MRFGQVAHQTTFTMSAKLDNTCANRDMHTIMGETANQLEQMGGVEVELSLEVQASTDEGIPVSAAQAISENCTRCLSGLLA